MKTRVARDGFSLIELLVVMSGLAIAMGFGTALLLSLLRTDQMAANSLNRLMRHYELADLFRDDVSNSLDTPDTFREFTAGGQCLVLRQPNDTWVIYQVSGHKLERIKRTGDKEFRRPVILVSPDCQVEFLKGDGNQALVTLRITEKTAAGILQRIDLSAALKGDLK